MSDTLATLPATLADALIRAVEDERPGLVGRVDGSEFFANLWPAVREAADQRAQRLTGQLRSRALMLSSAQVRAGSPPCWIASASNPFSDFKLGMGLLADRADEEALPGLTEHLEDWARRIEAKVGPGEFGLQWPWMEASITRVHRFVSEFFAPLGPLIGRAKAHSNCFFGNYRRTPFGFHFDNNHLHAFQISAFGERTCRLWHPNSLGVGDLPLICEQEREPRVKPTFSCTMAPGDIVYWPGYYLHGIEATGVSCGLTLVIESFENESRADACDEVARVHGLRIHAPPTRSVKVQPGDEYSRHSSIPIRWRHNGDALVVGCQGRVAVWDAAGKVQMLRLVAYINRAAGFRVQDLFERFCDDVITEDEVMGMVAFLVDAGACISTA